MSLRHEIPTHLEVVDRPFFGLTYKQFTGLALVLGGLAFLYNYGLGWLPGGPRLVFTVVAAILVLIVTLVRFEGLSISEWIFERVMFHFQPHKAVFGLHELKLALVEEERIVP